MRRASLALAGLALVAVAGSARSGGEDGPASRGAAAPAPQAAPPQPAAGSASIGSARGRGFLRGIAIPLHDEDPERDYRREVDEVAALGASAASIVVNLFQDGAASAGPARHARRTATDENLLRTIRAARARSLDVLVMPIVLLEHPARDDWRGSLKPPDVGAWFAAYERELVRIARVARTGGATHFCLGSELSSLERHAERWRTLIARLRAELPSVALTYSANWDHYEDVAIWDALDFVGLSGYYELTKSTKPTDRELAAAWGAVRDRILDWRRRKAGGKPLVFTEIGYTSQDGCASKPWNYYLSREVDLEEQRQCYEAFVAAWRGRSELGGVFFYEWWGSGGAKDWGYTPRGKPAEKTIRDFFAEMRGR